MPGPSYDEMYELLCVMRNEQIRTKQLVEKLMKEVKLPANRISFTLEEAAEHTGFKYHSLYNMVKTGKLKASQPGGDKGKVVVTRDELIRILQETEMKIE